MDNFILLICLIFYFCLFSNTDGEVSDGKYNRKSNTRGKYIHTAEGEYSKTNKWKYVHYDDGDRGRYIHVDIPYDGGYGPYAGGHEQYRSPGYDPTGEYSSDKYQRSKNPCDPFATNVFNDPRPDVYLEYGIPNKEKNQCTCKCEAKDFTTLTPRATTETASSGETTDAPSSPTTTSSPPSTTTTSDVDQKANRRKRYARE